MMSLLEGALEEALQRLFGLLVHTDWTSSTLEEEEAPALVPHQTRPADPLSVV